MSNLFSKVLNFVNWDGEEDQDEVEEEMVEEVQKPVNQPVSLFKNKPGKIVNMHSTSQIKVVIVQPEEFDDAQEICDHLKNKKPVVVNLEDVEMECAQRIIDFLSGAIYSLEGSIQKVSQGIFLLAPNNVDIMSELKEDMKNKSIFSWAK